MGKNFVSRCVKAGGIKRGIPQMGNVKKKKAEGKEKRASAKEITFCVVFMRSGTRIGEEDSDLSPKHFSFL